MSVAVEKDSRKGSKSFFVTLGGLDYYDSIRSDFLLYFEGVEEYCVQDLRVG